MAAVEGGDESGLKRQLGVFELTATGVGIILGAGIYVLIGEAAGLAGNGVWLPFMFCALAAAFTGLTYADLASRYPKAGATFESMAALVIAWAETVPVSPLRSKSLASRPELLTSLGTTRR